MSVRAEPGSVPAALVELTRRFGEPGRDLVAIAEGNTSTLVSDGLLAVKASGSRMERATSSDFVLVDVAAAAALLDDPEATQADLSELLTVSSGAAAGLRASIETLLHVAAVTAGGAAWVAHTHPTAVVGAVSVEDAPRWWQAPLFPDEAVVVGRPAWVGYEEPGLALGRAVLAAIRRGLAETGRPPRCVLLGNHGLVALGGSADEVEAVTAMTVKAARVRAVAAAFGTPAWLDGSAGEQLAARPDEIARRRRLAGRPS